MELVRGQGRRAERGHEHCRPLPRHTRQGQAEGQDEQRHVEHRHITVAVDEIPAKELTRVGVVDAKRPEKASADERHRLASPGISRPMDESRSEIRERHAHRSKDERPPCRKPLDRRESRHVGGQEGDGAHDGGDLQPSPEWARIVG